MCKCIQLYIYIHKDLYIEATPLEQVFLTFSNTKYQTYKPAKNQSKFPVVLLELQQSSVIALQETDTSYYQICALEHAFFCHSKKLMLKIFILGGIRELGLDMDEACFSVYSQD